MLSIGPKQPNSEKAAYLGSVVIQQIAFAVVSSIVILAGVLIFGLFSQKWGIDQLVGPLTVAVLASQSQQFLRRYFFAFGRPALAFAVDIVRYCGQIGILLWLLLSVKMDAGRTMWAISACSAASAFIGLGFFEKTSWNQNVFRHTATRHWNFSKWLLFSEIVRWSTGNFFMFVAGGMLGAAAVGAIRATQNLVGLSHILMLGLENVVPVGAARRLARGGIHAFLRYFNRMTIFGACGVGLIVVTAAVAPEFWLNLLYGKAYVGNAYLVRWWSVVYFVSFLALQVAIGLRTLEQTKSVFRAHIAAAVFSLIFVYPLIYYFNLVGVLLGSLIIVLIRIVLLSYGFFGIIKFRKSE